MKNSRKQTDEDHAGRLCGIASRRAGKLATHAPPIDVPRNTVVAAGAPCARRARARRHKTGAVNRGSNPWWGASHTGSKSLSPLVNGKAYLITAFWRKLVRVGPSPLVTHRLDGMQFDFAAVVALWRHDTTATG